MNFNRALQYLKEGRRISRPWFDYCNYLTIGINDRIYIFDPQTNTADLFNFSLEDFEANDWEVAREYTTFGVAFEKMKEEGYGIAHKEWINGEYLIYDDKIEVIAMVKEGKREIWTVNNTPKEHERILSEYWYLVEE